MDCFFLQKVVLERHRVHLSQLYALVHLARGEAVGDGNRDMHVAASVHCLFETLNRDLQILEDLLDVDG